MAGARGGDGVELKRELELEPELELELEMELRLEPELERLKLGPEQELEQGLERG